jgi:NTP pyrophosphatase (non-canonical NTP hydrolase)
MGLQSLAEHINELRDVCHSASYRAGWWHGPEPLAGIPQPGMMDYRFEARAGSRFGKALIAEKIALNHSELSEALEGVRKNKADEHLPEFKSIEVELADALIRLLDLAGALDLRLGEATVAKLRYNAGREDHKPEARAAAGGKAF